ncbi:MAG TPA: hypothetical protein VFZ17_03310, partial [Acidimicrobiia bacterium]|nr:hypothetical protein [Acidimicrobiia bacterium]
MVSLIVATLVSSGITVLGTLEPAHAALPGHNGLIAFMSDRDGHDEIYAMNAGGADQTRLTFDGENWDPTWSPDGSRLAFARSQDGVTDLYSMNQDGSDQTPLTDDGYTERAPTWSPDGSKIAFARVTDFVSSFWDIWVMDADGSNQVQLTSDSASDSQPSWSPDGSSIVFERNTGTVDIMRIDVDGTDLTNLTNSAAAESDPDWSPDGSRIVYSTVNGLRTMAPDGTGSAPVGGSVAGDANASWSPDGTSLVFASQSRHLNAEIYRLNLASGEGAVRLTNNAPPGNTLPQDTAPKWQPLQTPPSPDGEYTSLTPARIVDTRDGTGDKLGVLGSASQFDAQITGRGGVPASGVKAVVLNATVTQTTAASYLTVWPAGIARPVLSNLNYVPGQTVPNLVTVAVGANGRVSVYNNAGSTHVIFDVVGYYADPTGTPGGRFHSLSPFRFFDTRAGSGGVPQRPLAADETLAFDVTGKGGVPASVSAVVMNVTVTEPSSSGHITVYPGDVSPRPTTSNLNFVTGLTEPNLVIVRVPANGIVNFHNFSNFAGTVHLIADVVGYFDEDRSTESGRFVGANPFRVIDTRLSSPFPQPGCVGPAAILRLTTTSTEV